MTISNAAPKFNNHPEGNLVLGRWFNREDSCWHFMTITPSVSPSLECRYRDSINPPVPRTAWHRKQAYWITDPAKIQRPENDRVRIVTTGGEGVFPDQDGMTRRRNLRSAGENLIAEMAIENMKINLITDVNQPEQSKKKQLRKRGLRGKDRLASAVNRFLDQVPQDKESQPQESRIRNGGG